MGIQLDWQVESERQERRSTEDPAARQQRRAQRRRLIGAMGLVGLILALIIGAVLWRLDDVENRMRQDLLDTVDAEIRALKIGNEANYMAIRRTGSDAWIGMQLDTFAEYQRLKANGTLELTGRVLDVEMDIDESRARVTVEEIYQGEPYAVVWFYWYYTDDEQDGWRRVPPDIEFWGESRTEVEGNVRIQFDELDETLAMELAAEAPQWWQQGCELVNCGDGLPELTLHIDPWWGGFPNWDTEDIWTLRIASPYNDRRAPQFNVLTPELRGQIIARLAERIVQETLPSGTNLQTPLTETVSTEAYIDQQWLAGSFERWIGGILLEGSSNQPTFLDSVRILYGDAAPSLMLRTIKDNFTLGPVFMAATGNRIESLPIESLNTLYWNNYFEYRLRFEGALLRNDFEFVNQQQINERHELLYVPTRNGLDAALRTRQAFTPTQPEPLVNTVNILIGLDGSPIARVSVIYSPEVGPQDIDFQWNSDRGTWKRLNS